MAWGIGWTFIRELKSLENCSLMGSICPKHIMFELESFIGIRVDAKLKGKLTCGKHILFEQERFRGVMGDVKCKEWCKILKKVDSRLEKSQGIWLIFMRVVKSLKICTLTGSFSPEHIKF